MHPDLAPDDDARQHAEAFMKRLNQAFRGGDEEAIVDLVRQWEASPRPAAGGDPRRVTGLADRGGAAPVRGSRRSAAPSSPR